MYTQLYSFHHAEKPQELSEPRNRGASNSGDSKPSVTPDGREERQPPTIWRRQQLLLMIGIPFLAIFLYFALISISDKE